MRSWPDKDLWQRAGKKSGIFVKKSEKSPFYGGTCFFTRRGRDSGVAASRWWMREKERELTIDDLQLTIERQRDADLAAAGNHRLRRKWYKDHQNCRLRHRLRRPVNALTSLLKRLNSAIIATPFQVVRAAENYRLWVGDRGPARKIARTPEKRWSKIVTIYKSNTCGFGRLEKRVPVASRRVPVSRQLVLMSRLGVPVASQRVPIGYECLKYPHKSLKNHCDRCEPSLAASVSRFTASGEFKNFRVLSVVVSHVGSLE